MKHDSLCAIWLLVVMAFWQMAVMASQERVRLDDDPHLMGWWKFDETTGRTATDSSAYGRKGTLLGELTFDTDSVQGKVGRALRLGAADAVEIKGYNGVTGTMPRTVTAWIRTTKTSGTLVVWGTSDAGKQFRFGHIRGRIGMTPHGG